MENPKLPKQLSEASVLDEFTLTLSDGSLNLKGTYDLIVPDLILTNSSATVGENELYRNVTVKSGGTLYISSGGFAEDVFVSSGGRLVILDGGIASGVTAEGSGYATVSSGGKMISAYLAGGNCEEQVIIEEGGILSSAKMVSGLNLVVRGSAYDVDFSEGSGDYTDLFLQGNGYVENASFGDNSNLSMEGGTRINGLTIYGSNILIGVPSDAKIENLHRTPFTNDEYYNSIPAGAIVSYDDCSDIDISSGVFCVYGGRMVSSAVSMESVSLGPGYSMSVMSGGTANDVSVVSGARLEVGVGGVANAATVKEDAWFHVAGGEANDTVVSGSVETIEWDDWTETRVLRANMSVTGGVANGTTVSSCGYLLVSSGGTANSTTVNSGGSLLIYNGGEVNDTTVNSNGWMHASSGGTATDMALTGGILEIGRGGEANNTTVNSNGRLTVFSTGVANSTTVLFGSMTVSSGATANGIELSGFGSSSGAVSNGSLCVYSGGTADNVIMNNGGGMIVFSGAEVTNILEDGGYVQIEDGATVSFLENTISCLVVSAYRDATIHSNTTAQDTTVDGGWFFIRGGTANNTTILNGSMWISSGLADTVSIGSNCHLYVSSGGIASGVSTTSSGYVYVSSGGRLEDAYLSGGISGDMIFVEDGGVISGAQVVDGADLVISGTGAAYDVVLRDGHAENGDWSDLKLRNGGSVENLTVYETGSLEVGSNCTVSNAVIYSGAHLSYQNGAKFFNTVINSGVELNLRQDKTVVSGLTVNEGGRVYVGGTASGIVENGGWIEVSGEGSGSFASNTFSGLTLNNGQSATVHSGTTATSTTVTSGGMLKIFSSGIADGVAVSRGGMLQIDRATDVSNVKVMNSGYLEMTIDSGTNIAGSIGGSAFAVDSGKISGFETNELKRLNLADGGTANGTVVSGGGVFRVSSGGAASDTTISDGEMYVSSGGVANNTMINGGYYCLEGGGAANNIVLNGGNMTVCEDSVVAGLTVSGGQLNISQGATVTGLELENGVWMDLAVDSRTHIAGTRKDSEGNGSAFEIKDGRMDRFTMYSGRMTLGSGTLATDLSLIDSTELYVSGGTVKGVTANSVWSWWGGTYLYGDSLLTGRISIKNNIYFYDDASILFNVSELTPDGDTTRMDDYSCIRNNPILTATVSDAQMQGSYVLARNAGGFNGYISFSAEDGTFLEELNLGQQFEYAGKTYKLNLTDDVLTLDVETVAESVVITLTGDNTTPLPSATLTAETAVGSELYFSTDNQSWTRYQGSLNVTESATYYFKALDGAGNIGTNWITFGNIDSVPPDAPVVTANIETLTNKDVKLTAVYSGDSVKKEYSLDGGETWNNYTAAGIVMSENGTVLFRGTDVAGNVSEIVSRTVDYIDKTPPPTPAFAADITAPTNTDVTVTATFSEDSAVREYRIDNGAWTAYTEAVTMTKNGTVSFRSADAVGNYSETTVCEVGNIDKTAPVITLAGNNTRPAPSAVLTASTEDGVTIFVSTDNENWTEYTSEITVTENGTYYFKATDAVGNEGTNSITFDKIDHVPPEKPVASASITESTNSNLRVTAEFSEDSVTKEYSLDGEDWRNYYAAGILMRENGTVYFRGIDAAGNVSEIESYTVGNIDKTPPEAPTFEQDVTDPTNTDVTVTAQFSEDSVVREYRIGSGGWTVYTEPVAMTQNGTVSFRGQDEAGNYSETTTCRVENIDRTAPVIRLIGNTSTPLQSATLTATTEAGLTILFSTDEETWTEYAGQISVTANGAYYFKATDAAGNVGTNSIVFDNIDTEAPVITETALTQGANDYVFSVTLSATDNRVPADQLVHSVRYATSPDALASTAPIGGLSFTLTEADAAKTLYYQVSATDAAGNITWAPAKSFTVADHTAPVLNGQPEASYAERTLGIFWEPATDNVGVESYRLTLNGVDYDLREPGFVLESVESGTYTYQVTAYDAAGNETAGEQRTLTVEPRADLELSSVKILKNGRTATTISTQDSVTLSFQVANIGDVAATETEAQLWCGKVLLANIAVAAIEAGKLENCTYTIEAGRMSTGIQNLYVLVDAKESVTEYAELNNEKYLTLKVENQSLGDLVIGSIALDKDMYSVEDAAVLNFTVRNIGYAETAASKAYIYDGDVLLGSVDVSALGLGEETESLSYTIAAGRLAAGSHALRVVADGEVAIPETNRDNNSAQIQMTVGICDLTISRLTLSSDTVNTEEPVTVNFTVRNGGTDRAPASLVGIYDGNKLLGTVSLDELSGGLSLSRQFVIDPGRLSAGQHNLRVIADVKLDVDESDENNNSRSVGLLVGQKDDDAPGFDAASISVNQSADGYRFTVSATAVDNITPATDLVFGIRVAETAEGLETAEVLPGTEFAVSPDDAGKTLYCQVSATDRNGNIGWSPVQAFTVADHTAPEIGNISISTANAAFKLNWEATDNIGVASYNVYFDGTLVSSTETPSFMLADVAEGSHTYCIEAIDLAGNTSSTGTLNVNFGDTEAPVITGVSAVRSDDGSYGIVIQAAATDNITAAADLTARVQYAFAEEDVQDAPLTGLNLQLTPEDAGKTLYYRVSVRDEAGNTAWSEIQSLPILDTTAPEAPSDLAETVNGSAVALNWTASGDNVGVTGYQVRYGTGEVPAGDGVAVAENHLDLAGLKEGVYYWQTAAVDAAGNLSDWSEVKSFRILPEDEFGAIGTAETAFDLGTLSGTQILSGGAISSADDADWFKFTLNAKGTANDFVQIAFDAAQGDLDLYLYASNGTTLLASSESATENAEKISLKDVAKGTYLLKVAGKNGAMNEFSISTKKVAGYEPDVYDADDRNDTMEAATVFDVQKTPQATISDLNLHEPGDLDFYQFTLSNMGLNGDGVSIGFENSVGDLDLVLFDAKGTVVAESRGTGDTETISFNGVAAGTYYLQVSGAYNAVNEYSLNWNVTTNSVEADSLEGSEPFVFTESAELAGLSISAAADGVTREDTFRLTLAKTGSSSSKIRFSNYRSDWNGLKYTVKNSDDTVVLYGMGAEISLEGLSAGDYTLTVDTPVAGSYSAYDVSVSLPDASVTKWTYMVYMATDNGLDTYALYDLVSMQQADLDAQIDIYVLVDRSPSKGTTSSSPSPILNKWDSDWSDTRVGKISYSPGRNCSVDWESWGELDTSSAATLERFVTWTQEQSGAENYGLIMWDHGAEDGTLCVDGTTDADWGTSLTVSDVSSVLKDKGVSLVIFNNCLLGSELTVTQMAGSTDVIVASEAESYPSGATYGYKKFFSTITADMTAQEMAEILVQNVRGFPGDSAPSMLSAVDVTDTRLADALEALANAVSTGGNDADKSVLINGMLKSLQDGFAYPGNIVYQSDLYDVLVQAMADRNYAATSEGFKTAATNLKSVLEDVVICAKSVPTNRGYGVAVFNPALTAKTYAGAGYSGQQVNDLIYTYLNTAYGPGLAWTDLLYDLAMTYQNQYLGASTRAASFAVNSILDLEKSAVVSSMDLGCFSGQGEVVDGVSLFGELYFSIAVTEGRNTGKFTVANDSGADVSVSIISDTGVTVSTGLDGVAFSNLAAGDYYILLQSETDCTITLSFGANWATGVDRFDYAQSKTNEAGVNGNGSASKANALGAGYYSGLLTYQGDSDWYQIGNVYTDKYRIELDGKAGLTVEERDANGNLVQTAKFADGKYTMTMFSMNYLVVEGNADISAGDVAQRVNAYSVNITTAINDDTEDTVPPAAPVASSDAAGFTNGDVTVTATFSDDTVTKEYSLDGGTTWLPYDVNGIIIIINGTVSFRGTDAAGNVSDVTTYEVTNIDKVAPAAPSGLQAIVSDQIVTLSWTASTDDLSGVKSYIVTYSHDGQEFTATTRETSFVIENADYATWQWNVKAVDTADNVSSVTDGEAFAVVKSIEPEPEKKFVAGSDINGNGVSDVMFVWTGNNYQHGYWMNGTSDWQSADSNHPAEWENLGCYDMTGDGKADSVLVGNVVVNDVKGAYIGYYADANDADANWVNIGYLTNADEVVWKNAVGNLTGGAANSIVWYAPELYALGAWTDGTDSWVSITNSFGNDDWTLVGCGDFDGDGKDSIVMSGLNGQYLFTADLDGTSASMGNANWSGWEVRAIGDFKGDGKDDLVLFHKESGSMVMIADGIADEGKYTSLDQLDAKDWFVVGCGDYNGDQQDDLLVRQYSTGMLGYYTSGDTTQWTELGRGVDMNWTVIA